MAERISAGHGHDPARSCACCSPTPSALLREQVLESSLPDDPYLVVGARGVLPAARGRALRPPAPEHPLRREIVATIVTNDVINSMGITFVPRMAAETGADGGGGRPRVHRRPRREPRPATRGTRSSSSTRSSRATSRPSLMNGVDSMVEQLARWYLQHVHDIDLHRGGRARPARVRRARRRRSRTRPPTRGGWRPTAGSRSCSSRTSPDDARAVRRRRRRRSSTPPTSSPSPQATGRSIAGGHAGLLQRRRAPVPRPGRGPGGRPAGRGPLAADGVGHAPRRPAAAAPADRRARDRRVGRTARSTTPSIVPERPHRPVRPAVADDGERRPPRRRDDSSMVMVAVHQIRQVAA